MKKKPRKLRLPDRDVQLLRDLRDSHISTRPIPELVNAALRQARRHTEFQSVKLPREGTTVIDVILDDEFEFMEHSDIVARVVHILSGLRDKIDPRQIRINREGIIE